MHHVERLEPGRIAIALGVSDHDAAAGGERGLAHHLGVRAPEIEAELHQHGAAAAQADVRPAGDAADGGRVGRPDLLAEPEGGQVALARRGLGRRSKARRWVSSARPIAPSVARCGRSRCGVATSVRTPSA